MAITMMTSRDKAQALADELGCAIEDHPDIKVVHNYPGAESRRVCHRLECPNCPQEDKDKAAARKSSWNYEKHPVEQYPIKDDCLTGCHVTEPLYMHTTYRGCVLNTYERNGSSDSDFYASVWDDETGTIKSIEYATTRGWSYPNGATVDATNEVKAKANAYLKVQSKITWDRQNETEAKTPAKGKTLRVFKGRKVKIGTVGECFWYGKGKKFNPSRWARASMRVGLKVGGETVWVDADHVEVVDWEQYLKPDSAFYFNPPYGEWEGAKHRVAIAVVGNTAITLN